jgi:hypothetical protein
MELRFPKEDDLRWIVATYARLRAAHGDDIGTPELVLPTGDYFPDAFAPSPQGVGSMVRRMLTYAPVADDLHVELAFVEAEGGGGGGCGSGACGTEGGASGPVAEALGLPDGAGYRLVLPTRDVADAAVLGAVLARCVGGVVLGEAGEAVADGERLQTAEIAATLSGLGVLLACGSCVYAKSCGGLRAHQSTALDVGSTAVALALFLRVQGEKPAVARRFLETTQREAFDEALRWVDSNPAIVEALRLHPESLSDAVFTLEPAKGALARLFGRKAAPAPAVVAAPRERRARSEAEERRLAEDKALVEEALRRA